MARYSLYPAFIQLQYHSLRARHIALLPTRTWNELGGTRGAGGYVAWDGSNRDALDMIEDYTDDMALLMPDSSVIDGWIIFAYPDVDADPLPRAAGTLAVAGADTTPGWTPAVQFTYTYFDRSFFPVKNVILDAASNGDFSRTPASGMTSTEIQLPGGFSSDTNAWSSRAGEQPFVIRNLTRTLNRKLRKQYGLT